MVQSLDEHAIEVVNYPKGTTLFRQGEPGNAAFLVNGGSIGIYREVEDKRVPLATLRKGELFGEMAVIDGSPRMASAITLEDSTLTMISVELMSEKMKKTDPFIKALITMLLGNLRSVHDSYTPKSRSLLDSVSTLSRQCDALTKFLTDSEDIDLDVDVAVKVGELNEIVAELQGIADDNRDKERRGDALPPADPPT
ncbi:MAG: cyclic nucleotide-binding domain-containing protein [Rhodospirillaceae bacterium]|jgi:CRP/FNR family transcriptional regulator, cyclic AMP receptor protein|nr:cyclic nucleotide-binding domain-containing protein [Rhodospirillaceae bacterium]MBT5241875.1 cyclic nucleotide-binding domain-containing protein [Rhodospirillaceae bacterium]MBT5567024.1 cyclic nucleotide-binding domain-containing protein [Rhodospirillaceae bacterium]MBT6089583.1 cyclic nucleotide-binding domain-containing protein [Rhodospirillaceae bacterium]MBT6961367.1 cyclic nucleotide-binding domain-containing protein [Rhodospirillaceae bacterium]